MRGSLGSKAGHPVRCVLATFFLAVALMGVQPAAAQIVTTNEAVERLFTAPQLDPDWFNQSFLAQVPVDVMAGIVATLTADYGPFQEVVGEGGDLTTRLERAEFPTSVILDDEGRLEGLFFGPPIPIGGNLESFVSEIAALPGETSVLVITDGAIVGAHQPDRALAVGSAFKLLVLFVINQEIAAGNIGWDDVVLLEERHKSLPTGLLQDWPAGTPVTVVTAVNLMISMSDNTATDMLIELVGKEALEALSPANAPFLTTGELFRLKSRGNEQMIDAWINGDADARRAVLAALGGEALPGVDQLSSSATPEVEWFFNAFELCSLLSVTFEVPAFAINPGVAQPLDWASGAYKGGSETGVLNLSTWLTGHDGRQHCVVATWNNVEAVDEVALFAIFGGILRALVASE